jgi:hypothetical protein
VNRAEFDRYIERFNARDLTAFDDYIHEDLRMQNGGMVFHGRQGMKDHYTWIWKTYSEDLDVVQFTSDGERIAIEMKAHFEAQVEGTDTPFGDVVPGEMFDFHGLIMYQLEGGQFKDIRVAYFSFHHTDVDGNVTDRGLAH